MCNVQTQRQHVGVASITPERCLPHSSSLCLSLCSIYTLPLLSLAFGVCFTCVCVCLSEVCNFACFRHKTCISICARVSLSVCVRVCVGDCGRAGKWVYYGICSVLSSSLSFSVCLCLSLPLRGICR